MKTVKSNVNKAAKHKTRVGPAMRQQLVGPPQVVSGHRWHPATMSYPCMPLSLAALLSTTHPGQRALRHKNGKGSSVVAGTVLFSASLSETDLGIPELY